MFYEEIIEKINASGTVTVKNTDDIQHGKKDCFE